MRFVLSLCLVHALATLAAAQPDPGVRRPGGFPGGGPGGSMLRMLPVFAALDTNEDGAISMKELDAGPRSLAALDKDKSGSLEAGELEPEFGRGRRGGDGPRGGRPDIGNGDGDRPGGNQQAAVDALMQLDQDQDGQIERSEVSSQFESLITRGDANNDDTVTRQELTALISKELVAGGERDRSPRGRGRGNRPGFGGGPAGDGARRGAAPAGMFAMMMKTLPLMKALDADGNGEISKSEIQEVTANLRPLDAINDGQLTTDELRPDMSAFSGRSGFAPPGQSDSGERPNRRRQSSPDE